LGRLHHLEQLTQLSRLPPVEMSRPSGDPAPFAPVGGRSASF
jgi:hypothetical protein